MPRQPQRAEDRRAERLRIADERRRTAGSRPRVRGPGRGAVSATERSSITAVPSSRGWASGAGGAPAQAVLGQRQLVRNGEPTPSGWTAEQMSWTKPGSVSSAERQPPPTVAAASST